MGSLLYYQLTICLLLAMSYLLLKKNPRNLKTTLLGKLLAKLQLNLLWNGQIHFWRQNYIVISVAGYISYE